MYQNDSLISRTITFLRFPLIIAVVFIHTPLNEVMVNGISLVKEGMFPIYDLIFQIISKEIAAIAVPLFFFISGFLFFYKVNSFTTKVYFTKLQKRVKTLLIPYIFWNLIALSFTLLSYIFLSSMLSGRNELLTNYNYIDWLNIFWNNNNSGLPICRPFWFIRDLIIVILFSPFIYYLIKYLKVFGIIILGLLWIFGFWFDTISFSIISFFFFSFGAWFSVNNRDFILIFRKCRLMPILYIIILIISILMWYKDIKYNYIHNIGIIIGLLSVISLSSQIIEKNRIKPNTFLATSSFFIYAYHGMPIALLMKIYMKYTIPYINEWTMIIGYILIPFIVTSIGIGIYATLHKFFPSFTALITGGR